MQFRPRFWDKKLSSDVVLQFNIGDGPAFTSENRVIVSTAQHQAITGVAWLALELPGLLRQFWDAPPHDVTWTDESGEYGGLRVAPNENTVRLRMWGKGSDLVLSRPAFEVLVHHAASSIWLFRIALNPAVGPRLALDHNLGMRPGGRWQVGSAAKLPR